MARATRKPGGPAALATLCLVLLGWAVAAWAGAPTGGGLAGLIQRHDSAQCQPCHEDIYNQWNASHHARSMMGLNDWVFMSKYLKSGPLAVKKPEDATLANFPCAKCHLPQLLSADDQTAKELAQAIWRDDKQLIGRLNIGCLVCHQDKAVVHRRPEAGVIYGPRANGPHQGPIGQSRPSSFMGSPAFCGQCHGLGPNFEFTPPVQCATLYGSYLHAYVAGGGANSCNDCHMPEADHGFPPNFADRQATAKLYAAALPMKVETLPYVFQPGHDQRQALLVVGVTIANNAGHRIPDG